MKKLLASVVLTAAIALPAAAEPFCAALETVTGLPAKYQKRGPFFSNVNSGWIIGADQLKADYPVTDETTLLWAQIAAEFEALGAQLVVLAAPPRPLFASDTVMGSLGLSGTFDRAGTARAFASYIKALNNAGIVAPDLSALAAAETAYYFKRDTHWTPTGAALSAAHLRAALDGTSVQEVMADVPTSGTYAEKGSLSTVVGKTCGTKPAPESVAAPTFAKQGTAASLLADDTAGSHIALIGTSFSDRYQRDAYQVADALAHALDGSVENHAMTGGGLVGAMSAFIQSGALRTGTFQTVVWETPYTAPLTQIDGLRQVLGELAAARHAQRVTLHTGQVSDDWVSIRQAFRPSDYAGVDIHTPGQSEGTLLVELIAEDESKTRIKLVKSDRTEAGGRSDHWRFSLVGMDVSDVRRIKVRLMGQKTALKAEIQLF